MPYGELNTKIMKEKDVQKDINEIIKILKSFPKTDYNRYPMDLTTLSKAILNYFDVLYAFNNKLQSNSTIKRLKTFSKFDHNNCKCLLNKIFTENNNKIFNQMLEELRLNTNFIINNEFKLTWHDFVLPIAHLRIIEDILDQNVKRDFIPLANAKYKLNTSKMTEQQANLNFKNFSKILHEFNPNNARPLKITIFVNALCEFF